MSKDAASDQNAQPAQNIQSPFAENLFLVDHKSNHKFVNVAKCGVTTIKQVIAEHEGIKYQTVHDLHKVFGTHSDKKLAVRIDQDLMGDDYRRVAVWRDPVQRFMSWYRDKVLKPKQPYVFQTALAVQHDEERLLEFVKFELNKVDPEWMDEHLRPQSDYYQAQNIDLVVELKDLNRYLKKVGALKKEPKKFNVTNKQEANDLSPWLKKKIKQLYAADYRLHREVKPKIWQP